MMIERSIEIDFSEDVINWLSEEGFDPQFGARPLKRVIQKEIVNELSKKILAGEVNNEDVIFVDVFDGNVVFSNKFAEYETLN